MGLATIDPHSQKEHTKIHKIPKLIRLFAVTQISNSPLNSKRIVQSRSWTFSSNDTVTLSQHLFTERRPLLACTQNGTPSHLGNTK